MTDQTLNSAGPSLRAVLERRALEQAWQQVRANRGAPGVDEVSVDRWERHWQENLDRLSRQVRANTYHPNRPRRFRVLKPEGGWRELCILTVTDRVLQRAVLNALEPAFEAVFLDGSYGYRPGRSVVQAVERVLHERDRGYGWLLDADIRSCFESLEHAVVLEHVRQVVRHPLLLRLIALWLGAAARPSPDRAELVRIRNGVYARLPPGPRPRVGVPLGAVISPLLCNVVLHQLDLALERAGWHWVRYADDFVVLTRTRAEAEQAWDEVEAALRGLRLQLNPEKTRIASFDQGFKFLGVTFKGDTYSYVYAGQRYEVRGRNVSFLWNHHIPEPYDWGF